MAKTLIRLKHEDTVAKLFYPAWSLAGPVREQHVQRMARTPTGGGVFLKALGRNAVVMGLQLTYRSDLAGEHWQAPLNRLRSLEELPLEVWWGGLEWQAASGWFMENLNIQYGPQGQYPDDEFGANPVEGGMEFPSMRVDLNLVTAKTTVRWPS